MKNISVLTILFSVWVFIVNTSVVYYLSALIGVPDPAFAIIDGKFNLNLNITQVAPIFYMILYEVNALGIISILVFFASFVPFLDWIGLKYKKWIVWKKTEVRRIIEYIPGVLSVIAAFISLIFILFDQGKGIQDTVNQLESNILLANFLIYTIISLAGIMICSTIKEIRAYYLVIILTVFTLLSAAYLPRYSHHLGQEKYCEENKTVELCIKKTAKQST